MKPVMQTKLEPPKGNCWAACVASVLEVELECVPAVEFTRLYGEEDGEGADVDVFWDTWDAWLAERNIARARIALPNGCDLPKGYLIVAGKGPRGMKHCVVYHNGQLAHDPYPGGAGVERVTEANMLYPLDPALPIGS